MKLLSQKERARLHEIIFEADTREGRIFDLLLFLFIIGSLFAVCLESVASVRANYGASLRALEWFFTFVFTIEYLLRVYTVKKPENYVFSFFGIIDLISILPSYLSLFFPGAQALLVFRALRLLRVFRVLKLARFVGEEMVLLDALKRSREKITVFLFTVLSIVLIMGALMYVVEGPENGFDNIPRGIYWAIVTLTTVGYGDITPGTVLGQTISAAVMILGYAVIAIPTGIITTELGAARKRKLSTQVCRSCNKSGHESDAIFCKFCGHSLHE